MSLREEIDSVRIRALSRLNTAHDYYTYTKEAWVTLQQGVERDGRKISWLNLATNSRVNEKDLLVLAQRYVQLDLASSTLLQFVSVFENFLFDIVRAWLLAYPERLSKRQLTGREILGAQDKPAIVDALVEKELRDVFYDRTDNWFAYLKELVKIESPTVEEAVAFAEIKATRDVLVHGQGIANGYYIDKARSAARSQLGQPLDIPEPYHQASWNLIRKLIGDVGTAMAGRL